MRSLSSMYFSSAIVTDFGKSPIASRTLSTTTTTALSGSFDFSKWRLGFAGVR